RKSRMAADGALSSVSAEARRRKKMLDDDRMLLAKAEKSLFAFDLENNLLENRAAQIEEQRTSSQATLSGRRTRLTQLEDQIAHTSREASLAESDVDKRVRVLDDRKRHLEAQRELLSAARAESRGLAEVDRAFESASPAL